MKHLAAIVVDGISKYKYDGSMFSSREMFDEEPRETETMFSRYMSDSQAQLILDLDLFRHFFNYAEAMKSGAEEGNLELMKYAVETVENLKQFDISMACIGDMMHLAWTGFEYATHVEEHKNCSDCKCTPLFRQKRSERHWIFNVFDAMGKVPAGIMSGNNLWVGSWNTCRKIDVVKNAQGQKWKGQYCLATIDAYERDNPLVYFGNMMSGPPDKHCYESTPQNVSKDDSCFALFPVLKFGVCMPNTCTNHDVKTILTYAIKAAESAAGTESVCNVDVECRAESYSDAMSENRLAMFALYLLIATVVLVLFGTLFDLFIISNIHQQSLEASALNHFFIKFILAFSMYSNGSDILQSKKNDREINSLHGVRFLSMCWIILGHTYYYIGTSLTTDNLVPTLINFPKQFHTLVISQAPLAVDSFFFLSGMLAAFSFFKRTMKADPNHPPKLSAYNFVTWPMYFYKRYVRITPTYMVVMLFDVTLFSYISNGPFWRPIEKQGCKHAWWTNFIYLNNFLLQDVECCMGWTWYLANDMQFHIFLMPLLVIVFLKFGMKAGLGLSSGLIGLSSLIRLVISQLKGYPPAPLLTANLQIVHQLNDYWNDVYVRPYIRCTPFIVGIVVAYLLNAWTARDQKDLKITLKKRTILIGWTISTLLGVYAVFGLYWYAKTGEISKAWEILYTVFGTPAFSIALGWVVFACTTGNGGPIDTVLSWRLFVPLSKITFCAYLLHPIMLQIYNLSRPQPFHFTTFIQMIRYTVEAIFASYTLAFFFALMFEKPFNKIDEMIFDSKKAMNSDGGEKRNATELAPLNKEQYR
uniref:NRF domain-containing protein n=1 Tax=Caenorhabditis japonica TaxID=281687 RepID=A0A8R1DYJ6_CAEJA